MKADTVVLLPPVPELLTYVVDVMHSNVLQQLLIHCPVKTLNLAQGLRMPDPSVDRQDIQLREQTFELRAALLEAGKLCAIVRKNRLRETVLPENLKESGNYYVFGVVCTVTYVRKQLVKGINGDGPLG